jgi:hypothetical protein
MPDSSLVQEFLDGAQVDAAVSTLFILDALDPMTDDALQAPPMTSSVT